MREIEKILNTYYNGDYEMLEELTALIEKKEREAVEAFIKSLDNRSAQDKMENLNDFSKFHEGYNQKTNQVLDAVEEYKSGMSLREVMEDEEQYLKERDEDEGMET